MFHTTMGMTWPYIVMYEWYISSGNMNMTWRLRMNVPYCVAMWTWHIGMMFKNKHSILCCNMNMTHMHVLSTYEFSTSRERSLVEVPRIKNRTGYCVSRALWVLPLTSVTYKHMHVHLAEVNTERTGTHNYELILHVIQLSWLHVIDMSLLAHWSFSSA